RLSKKKFKPMTTVVCTADFLRFIPSDEENGRHRSIVPGRVSQALIISPDRGYTAWRPLSPSVAPTVETPMAKNVDNKRQSPVLEEVMPKLPGLTFVFSGMFRYGEPREVARLIESEGGRVVEEVAKGVDYLIVGWPKRGHPSDEIDRARRRHKSLGEAFRIVEELDFYKLMTPTRDEALTLLAGGSVGLDRWKQLTRNLPAFEYVPNGINLAGVDFRGADLRGFSLDCVKLEGNDFSGADLSEGRFDSAVNCK